MIPNSAFLQHLLHLVSRLRELPSPALYVKHVYGTYVSPVRPPLAYKKLVLQTSPRAAPAVCAELLDDGHRGVEGRLWRRQPPCRKPPSSRVPHPLPPVCPAHPKHLPRSAHASPSLLSLPVGGVEGERGPGQVTHDDERGVRAKSSGIHSTPTPWLDHNSK